MIQRERVVKFRRGNLYIPAGMYYNDSLENRGAAARRRKSGGEPP